jgi:hypothetical protein
MPDSAIEPRQSARGSRSAAARGSGSTISRNASGDRNGAVRTERETAAIHASQGHDGMRMAFLARLTYSAAIRTSSPAISHSLGVENGRGIAGQQASGKSAAAAGISRPLRKASLVDGALGVRMPRVVGNAWRTEMLAQRRGRAGTEAPGDDGLIQTPCRVDKRFRPSYRPNNLPPAPPRPCPQ